MSTEENKRNNELVDDKLLFDHDYDGIKELNNPPPPWLMMIFYGTIIWSAFYVFHYHILKTGPSQADEYAMEMKNVEAEAKATVADFDESKLTLATDEASLAKGLEIFAAKGCAACHGANGEGNAIGPNLADKYWIHGNAPDAVFKSIKYGIPEKGMTPFKDQMSNEDMLVLTSFILNKMVGTEPANAKAPQGDLYE
jgi:cytochrome c oxidase cbb3-type subunit III